MRVRVGKCSGVFKFQEIAWANFSASQVIQKRKLPSRGQSRMINRPPGAMETLSLDNNALCSASGR